MPSGFAVCKFDRERYITCSVSKPKKTPRLRGLAAFCYTEDMIDLYASVTVAVSATVLAQTGRRLDVQKWRQGGDAPLACFIGSEGDRGRYSVATNSRMDSCATNEQNGTVKANGAVQNRALSQGETEEQPLCSDESPFAQIPLVAGLREKNGWLSADLTDAFYMRVCELLWAENENESDASPSLPHVCRSAPAKKPLMPYDEKYLENRLRLLMRHGRRPCPAELSVQRALWLAICCAHHKHGRAEAAWAILSMSHHKEGMARVLLERDLGGVAEAMLVLLPTVTCNILTNE